MAKLDVAQTSSRSLWQKFRQQRSALFAFWAFLWIFVLSLAVPLIANDKPLWVNFRGQWSFPIIYDYPETHFGGVFETPAVYSDPAVRSMIEQNGDMLMPPIAYNEYTLVRDADMPHPAAPNGKNLLGTDDVGRDVLARVLYALRNSLVFSLLLTALGSLLGVVVGVAMGYFAGLADLLGQRAIEIFLGLPQLFILMILASLFVPSASVLFVLMLSFGWAGLVPLVRLHVLKMRQMPFVVTAKNMGIAPTKIIVRHILPSTLLLVLSQLPFIMVANIGALTTLDFLGFGLPIGSASFGEILLQGKNHLDAKHLVLSGFLALSLVLILLIMIGEGLREALDER